jgi:rhodanese-related sulfurtransferase
MMNIITTIFLAAFSLALSSCGNAQTDKSEQKKASVTDVSVDEFKTLKDKQPGIVLDVRTPREVAEGKIENAEVIDITQPGFMDKASKLPKDQPVYVYCKAGGRSANASQKLLDAGFTQVYNVLGGMDAWKGKGYPVVQ